MTEPASANGGTAARPLLLAVLLTSLFWATVGGTTLFLWRRPQPVVFEMQPPPATATPQPTPTAAPLTVEVKGAVQRPGIYQLPPGSRVQQALEEAGGLTAEGAHQALELARPLADGETLRVPAAGEPAATERPAMDEPAGIPININQASSEDLQALPGIGPVTAQAIIDYRQANGPFASVEALVAVKGIGEATVGKIKDMAVAR